MSTWASPQKPLSFPAFWHWLRDHGNCILAASYGAAALFDDDALHWAILEQEEHRAVLQLILGKNLVGELVIDASEVDEVEVQPDPEDPKSGNYLAELLSNAASGRQPLGHVLLAHGIEETRGHPALRH